MTYFIGLIKWLCFFLVKSLTNSLAIDKVKFKEKKIAISFFG